MVKADIIICLDCGTSWKEISASVATKTPTQISITSKQTTLEELRTLARNGDANEADQNAGFTTTQTSETNTQHPNAMAYSFGVIACLFLAIIGGSIWFSQSVTSNGAQSASLIVDEVNLREQIGRDGKKVVTVKGSIQNGSDTAKVLPPIAIILRKNDGGEIMRWRHLSPKPVIDPGVKTRFVSSIQVDAPIIAYAEAILE